MNLITIELCAEDRARLDRLVAALENAGAARSTKKNVEKSASKTIEPDPEQVTIETAQQENESPESTAPVVTEDDIRSLARVLIEQGKKPQLKEIVNKYAPSITDIPDESKSLVYEQLKTLAGV